MLAIAVTRFMEMMNSLNGILLVKKFSSKPTDSSSLDKEMVHS